MDSGTRQSTERLVPIASLQEFFRDSIDAALATNKVTVDDHTSHYVVNLLTLFSRSEQLYEPTEDGLTLKPLAIMLADAMDANTNEVRHFALQRLGDVSLFIAGFFADGLSRSAVDVDYYVQMGGSAYHSLSVGIRGTVRGQAFGAVFTELSEKFQDIVDVLNEVRESARDQNDTNALRLYELWLKTGSQRAVRLLKNLGIHPINESWNGYEH